MRVQTQSGLEIIVVDNASTDTSVAYITKQYPEVKVIQLEQNNGFAAAVNQGILQSSAPLIALLNNDTEVEPKWAEALVQAAMQHSQASLFASKMVTFNDHSILDSCGDAMTWTGRSYKIGEGEKDQGQYDTSHEVFGACAGAAAYRREVFTKIGLFDETFFAYLEDVDIDFRAQLAGLHCYFVPEAIVAHIGSATSGRDSRFAFQQMIKNHFYLIYKNYPSTMLRKHLGKLFYAEIRLIAASIRDHRLATYVAGVYQAVREFPQMNQKRASTQATRVATDAQLNEVIAPHFHYGHSGK